MRARQGTVAAASVLLTATLVAVVTPRVWSGPSSDVAEAELWWAAFAAAATVTAIVSAALLGMWWRSQLSAPALWWSLAMAAIGVHTAIGFGAVFVVPNLRVAGAAQASVSALAAYFAVRALRSPAIDLTSRGGTAGFLVAAAALAVGGGSWLLEVDWIPLAGWGLIAAVVLSSGLRERDVLAGWFGVGVLGVLHHQVVGLDSSVDAFVTVTSGILLALALLVMMIGVLAHIDQAHASVQRRLLAADARVQALQVSRDADLLASERRLHEARSALAALDYATRLMPSIAGEIPLADAVRGEVALLRRLVTPGLGSMQRFLVADALAGAVAVERLYGVDVVVRVPPQLQAFGDLSATAEAAQCLLENARIHADGAPIEVSASRVGGEVHIVVADGGPGVDPEAVGQIFGRGYTTGAGNGLGLGIAQAIMEQQGGRLWLDLEIEGGARFVAALPALGPVQTTKQLDDLDQGERVGGRQLTVPLFDAGMTSHSIEGDDDVGL